MKNIKIFNFIIAALLLGFSACTIDPEIVEYDETNTQNLAVGQPYVQVVTPVIAFQAGTANYALKFNTIHSLKKLASVNVYSTFKPAGSTTTSNEALFKSYTVTADAKNALSSTITYADLKNGLTFGGQPLPANELDLAIGSSWTMRFEGVLTNGQKIDLPGSINVAVLSRFAGLYKVVNSKYYRIGVLTGNWNTEERYIGSVNAETFSYNDYWGYFPWAGKSFRFKLNANNTIQVPIITGDGLFSGTYAINCTDNADKFANVPCEGSNLLVPNDATGKHKLYLTYGYFTDGSGAREFYEELEKIVN